MSNELQIFNNRKIGVTIRTIMEDDMPWFVAKDICDYLGIQTNHISEALSERDRGLRIMETPSGQQNMVVISEPGLYKLIFRSRKPEAEAFTDWVCREVLPALRKTGHYGQPQGFTLTDANKVISMVQEAIAKKTVHRMQFTYPGRYFPISAFNSKYKKYDDKEDTLDAISLEMGYGIKMSKDHVKSWHEDIWNELDKREQAAAYVQEIRRQNAPKPIQFDI